MRLSIQIKKEDNISPSCKLFKVTYKVDNISISPFRSKILAIGLYINFANNLIHRCEKRFFSFFILKNVKFFSFSFLPNKKIKILQNVFYNYCT